MKLTTLFVSVLVAVGSLIAATAIPGANMVSVDIQGKVISHSYKSFTDGFLGANQATEAIGTTLEKRNAQGGGMPVLYYHHTNP
jgi:hypothetical protein